MPRASSRPPIIAINTYAGSLVIAAQSIGCDVVGSYEHDDRAEGVEVQRLNFPNLPYANARSRWPNDDLAGAVVIAHPPCAAFSSQNRTADRGTDASTFARTTDTIEYALARHADALLVESFVGALHGASEVFDTFAQRYGYRLYRVVQNAMTFGVPQDRERFWAIFVREGLVPPTVWFAHEPVRRSVAQVLLDTADAAIPAVSRRIDRQRQVLANAFGHGEADRVLNGTYGFGPIRKPIARAIGTHKLSPEDERRLCLSGFRAEQVKVLDPDGVAGVLLHNSVWACRGRALSAIEYRRVMGYPDTYRFPVDDWRRLISKGVCPPVAAWLLDQVLAWIEERTPPGQNVHLLAPGDVLDIR